MEFDNIETVKRAVEIDAGVAIVPRSSITSEAARQTVAAATLNGGEVYRPLSIVYKRNKVLSPALKQFVAVLRGETKA
jgi:DNA-binding transcriptional LysR family regulator